MFTIVVSILLAFSIDAWWDARREHDRERVALSGMLMEFRESAGELERNVSYLTQRQSALEILRLLSTAQIPVLAADSLGKLLFTVTLFGSFDPQVATLDALKGAGDLDIIRSDRLRGLLAKWESQFRDASETQAFLSRATTGDLYAWFRRGPPMPTLGDTLPEIVLSPNEDVVGYLRTREFQNLAIQNYWMGRTSLFELKELQGTIAEIISVLESELSDDGQGAAEPR